MTLLEKLSTIDKPYIKPLQPGEAESISRFWDAFLMPRLPDAQTVLEWHKLLMQYIKTDYPTFAIRGYNSFPPDQYGNLRRGFLTDTQEFSFFYTDNFFAFYIQKMCLDGFVPAVKELISAFNNRQFPSRFGRNTIEERELLAVKQGKDPKISAAGFKLAHILPIGKGYVWDGHVLGSKEILEYYFPKGERDDWKLVQDKTGSYYKRQLQVNSKAKRYAIAHFLRFVHPFNYFLCPKKDFEFNDKCKELAEYPPLLCYAHDFMLKMYGNAYREFLDLIMVPQNYNDKLFNKQNNQIKVQFGLPFVPKQPKIQPKEKQEMNNIEKIRQDLQTLDLKELIIKHYLGQYRLEEIQQALEPLNISVSFEQALNICKPLLQPPKAITDQKENEMSKQNAIDIFNKKGYNLKKPITYASKNSTTNSHWANPRVEFLSKNWNLILNDFIHRTLYLFQIPAFSFQSKQFYIRLSPHNRSTRLLNIEITYGDDDFTDKSGVKFIDYMVGKAGY